MSLLLLFVVVYIVCCGLHLVVAAAVVGGCLWLLLRVALLDVVYRLLLIALCRCRALCFEWC